jgi:hypothetical protein
MDVFLFHIRVKAHVFSEGADFIMKLFERTLISVVDCSGKRGDFEEPTALSFMDIHVQVNLIAHRISSIFYSELRVRFGL